jgi:hypothetical protein
MKKLIYISIASFSVALILFTSSCVKVNQIYPNGTQATQLFKDSAGLSKALVGLYSTLEVQEYYGAYYPLMCDLNSDNGYAGGYNNNAINEFGAYSVTSSNAFLQNTYVAIYKTIASANAIIAGEATVTGASTQYLNAVKGQALALRAMAHFDLLRAFGYHWDITSPYGIPVVTTPQTSTSIVPRATVIDTYNAIIADLQQSADLLKNNSNRNPNYVNPAVVNALLARVYLYKKDYANAAKFATLVINDGSYAVIDQNRFTQIYTTKNSKESIFELPFNSQTQSGYNAATYARPTAALTEVLFALNSDLQSFFQNRPGDLRYNLVDTTNPNGFLRTLKYSSDIKLKDNSAYIIRISEMYLIRAEALGNTTDGINDLNKIRTNRGLPAYSPSDSEEDGPDYFQVLADENRAEFNFEGHRYFDLARTGDVVNYLQPLTSATLTVTNSCFPIPLREINATGGVVVQNPGY